MSFFHQACTRLVRADYCGNGVYHTATGTSIDVYDSLNIQTRTGEYLGWSSGSRVALRRRALHPPHPLERKADATQSPEYCNTIWTT